MTMKIYSNQWRITINCNLLANFSLAMRVESHHQVIAITNKKNFKMMSYLPLLYLIYLTHLNKNSYDRNWAHLKSSSINFLKMKRFWNKFKLISQLKEVNALVAFSIQMRTVTMMIKSNIDIQIFKSNPRVYLISI